jgi:hypothetical protein
MSGTVANAPKRNKRTGRVCAVLAAVAAGLAVTPWSGARAIGPGTAIDVRGVDYKGGNSEPRPTARKRLAWEVRKRTSIKTRLEPSRVRFDDPSVFETPFLYWSGDQAFPELSPTEIKGLRQFVDLGGFLLISDASPEQHGFDRSVRRALNRAFPSNSLRPLPEDHTLYRSFYLVDRPVGRIEGPDHLEAIMHAGRAAVVYSRHDLGGAWARDNLGTWLHNVTPGGKQQRENSMRLGVNIVMYALCLDYKDDQVHAPFIMRRRGGSP